MPADSTHRRLFTRSQASLGSDKRYNKQDVKQMNASSVLLSKKTNIKDRGKDGSRWNVRLHPADYSQKGWRDHVSGFKNVPCTQCTCGARPTLARLRKDLEQTVGVSYSRVSSALTKYHCFSRDPASLLALTPLHLRWSLSIWSRLVWISRSAWFSLLSALLRLAPA